MNDFENDLIQIYHIEPHKKLDKLDEEIKELSEAVQTYHLNDDILPVIKELCDVVIVIIGLAIVRHGLKIGDIMYEYNYKKNRSLKIRKIMRRKKISYDEARLEVGD